MPSKSVKKVRKYSKTRRTKQLATKTYVKKMINKDIETKYHDLSLAAQPYSISLGATQIIELSIPAQGTTDLTRIGDKITIRGLDIRMHLTSSDTYNIIRCIIFQWYPNTSITSAPVGSQILNDVTTYPYISPYVHDYTNQYGVLYDKMFTLSSLADTITRVVKIKPRLKYCKKTINFSAAGTNGSNKLYMLLVSDSGAVTHPTANIHSRLFYDDA